MHTLVIPPVHYPKLYCYDANVSRTKLDLQIENTKAAMEAFNKSALFDTREPHLLISSRASDKSGDYFGCVVLPMSNFRHGYSIVLNEEWELVARKRTNARKRSAPKSQPADNYVRSVINDKE